MAPQFMVDVSTSAGKANVETQLLRYLEESESESLPLPLAKLFP
jgi:hypothetical protein